MLVISPYKSNFLTSLHQKLCTRHAIQGISSYLLICDTFAQYWNHTYNDKQMGMWQQLKNVEYVTTQYWKKTQLGCMSSANLLLPMCASIKIEWCIHN